jgi:hypothetical protein
LNSLCFDQADMAFTPGVLAFTRVITADRIGEQLGVSEVSVAPGQILDADIYFNSGDSNITFATPLALAANPKSYDLESILTRELGHLLGFSHSAIWNAMMFPYAHMPGTFSTPRPTAQQPDALLEDDDRTGLHVLYSSLSDPVHIGSVAGRIILANPLSLPASPPGVTGIFGAQVVAVDSASGAVIAGTIGGWSCTTPGLVQFDGGYKIEKLSVGHNYAVYAEPLDGAVDPSQLLPAIQNLCRNASTDAGWPPAVQLRSAPTQHAVHGSHAARAVNPAMKLRAIDQLEEPGPENGSSHPPPNRSPGPSDAKKIGPEDAVAAPRRGSSAA